MSAARIRAVLFDFDGVILDSAELKTEAFVAVYADEATDRREQVAAYQRAHGGIGRREKFVYFERELFGRPGEAARVDELCRRFAARVDDALLSARFIPGAEETLAALLGKVRMHVVSGMPDPELRAVIGKRDLARFFASIAGSPTTKIDAFRAILDADGLAAGDCLAVGDSTTEFEAARALGIPFLGIVPSGRDALFPADTPTRPDLRGFAELVLSPTAYSCRDHHP